VSGRLEEELRDLEELLLEVNMSAIRKLVTELGQLNPKTQNEKQSPKGMQFR